MRSSSYIAARCELLRSRIAKRREGPRGHGWTCRCGACRELRSLAIGAPYTRLRSSLDVGALASGVRVAGLMI